MSPLTGTIIVVSLLIVIVYIAARWTGVIQFKNDGDYLRPGWVDMWLDRIWSRIPHRYVYWDHCDRCYGRWEQTEIPESVVEIDGLPWCGDPQCDSPQCWEAGETRERGEYLTTTPGTSMEIVNDGTVIFDGPGDYHLEMAVEINRDSLSELEWRAMFLRANSPHLFSDDWYRRSRQEFSHWAVGEWEKIDAYQQEMRIGAYAA